MGLTLTDGPAIRPCILILGLKTHSHHKQTGRRVRPHQLTPCGAQPRRTRSRQGSFWGGERASLKKESLAGGREDRGEVEAPGQAVPRAGQPDPERPSPATPPVKTQTPVLGPPHGLLSLIFPSGDTEKPSSLLAPAFIIREAWLQHTCVLCFRGSQF